MSRPHSLPGDERRVVTLRIPSRLDHVELAARGVRGLCAGAGLPPRECAHVELAVAEAVNNSIRHAYRGEPGHVVEIRFTLEREQFTIEVADEGVPMVAPPARTLDFDPADLARLPEGGMGLPIIHSVMERVEYTSRDGRNALSMTRRLAA